MKARSLVLFTWLAAGCSGGGTASHGGVGGVPTFAAEMTAEDAGKFYGKTPNGGTVTFGAANAAAPDNAVAELLFKGDPSLGPTDRLSPDWATSIESRDGSFRYGTYRTRVQLARCETNEELVNGVFAFFNDGTDHDGDGLADDSEIDIEIQCSDPSIISLTIWTEYNSDEVGANHNTLRVIDTTTGDWEDTRDTNTVLGSGNDPAFKQTFPDPNAFYEMGFEWHAGSIRYFMVFGGTEVTLWNFTDAQRIPRLATAFIYNVWHSADWRHGGAADYPAADATMRVDWLRYWQQ